MSEFPERYHASQLAPGTEIHHRDDVEAAMLALREMSGVSAIVYDQTCAAEKRRRRKRELLPDPDLRWNEQRQAHDYTQPDYDELMRVIKGDGPCNRQRMAHRRRAHTDGVWVREAAAAYAAKHRRRTVLEAPGL